MEEDQSLDEVNATFRVKDLQQEEFHHVPLVKESLSSTRDEEKSAEAQRKIVSTHELPAPYGCRSVATKEGRHLRVRINMRCLSPVLFNRSAQSNDLLQTCSRVPMTVAKKMPYEKCKQVVGLFRPNFLQIHLLLFLRSPPWTVG